MKKKVLSLIGSNVRIAPITKGYVKIPIQILAKTGIIKKYKRKREMSHLSALA